MPKRDDPLSIAIVAGIRSQHIKMAALQRAISEWAARGREIRTLYINAGQHYDAVLASQFIEELGILYDVVLAHTDRDPMVITASIIVELHKLFTERRAEFDYVIVFGDANTTLAGAVAAAKAGLPLVHVESGVRVGSLQSSEEVNRVVADRLSLLRFATTREDFANLEREALATNTYWVGDVVRDLVLSLKRDGLRPGIEGHTGPYVLASLHRDENLHEPFLLETVLEALEAARLPAFFITHPRAAGRADDFIRIRGLSRVKAVHGMNYHATLAAILGSQFLFTDSGAFQREAFYLGKRCVVRQERAFWPTFVRAGIHSTCGTTRREIDAALERTDRMVLNGEPYPEIDDFGDGTAASRIIAMLHDHLNDVRHSRMDRA